MHAIERMNFGGLEGHWIDAGKVGHIGATTVIINLTRIISHIQITTSRHKHGNDVGEWQCGYNPIGGGINHMKPPTLLDCKHILAKAHHVTALVLIEAIIVTLGTGLGAVDGANYAHAGHVNDKNARIGRDIAFVGSDCAVGSPIIDAVGRLAEPQDAALLLQGGCVKHSETGADGATRRLSCICLFANEEKTVAKELPELSGHAQLLIRIHHRKDVVLHLVVVIVVVVE